MARRSERQSFNREAWGFKSTGCHLKTISVSGDHSVPPGAQRNPTHWACQSHQLQLWLCKGLVSPHVSCMSNCLLQSSQLWWVTPYNLALPTRVPSVMYDALIQSIIAVLNVLVPAKIALTHKKCQAFFITTHCCKLLFYVFSEHISV